MLLCGSSLNVDQCASIRVSYYDAETVFFCISTRQEPMSVDFIASYYHQDRNSHLKFLHVFLHDYPMSKNSVREMDPIKIYMLYSNKNVLYFRQCLWTITTRI